MPIRTIKREFGRGCDAQVIGIAGEINAAILEIDVSPVSAAHPNANYAIIIKRGADPPYIAEAALSRNADNKLVWVVCDYALSQKGQLQVEVQAHQQGTLIKSFSWTFWITCSLSATGVSPPPTGQPSWVDDLLDKISGIESSIVVCANKYARPAFGEVSKIYLVGDAAYVWIASPPHYAPLMWDADDPTQIELIDGGEES